MPYSSLRRFFEAWYCRRLFSGLADGSLLYAGSCSRYSRDSFDQVWTKNRDCQGNGLTQNATLWPAFVSRLIFMPQAYLGLRNYFRVCKVLSLQCAPVAQLDRAFDYETGFRLRINPELTRNQSINET
jgi:hypothetical protein